MPITFETIYKPPRDLLEFIDNGLEDFNNQALGDVKMNYQNLAIVARADQAAIIGGLTADVLWDWMHIQDLWVDAPHRGQDIGTRLMNQAEQIARDQGLFGLHLETTDFQALGFYQKLGYAVFGQIDNKPVGHVWYFLKKVIRDE